jgi:hypothetical protein
VQRDYYYNALFIAAACWNWLAGGAILFAETPIRSWLGMPASNDPLSAQLFAATVIAFGIGYYLVGRETSRNRDLVKIGIVGKVLVFLLSLYHALAGDVPFAFVAAAAVDMIFAILFVEFLLHTSHAPHGDDALGFDEGTPDE